MDSGTLFIVSAPSGGGKNTVIHAIMQWDPSLHYSVSATTRSPRPREKEGVHYFFYSVPQFEEGIQRGEFIEWAQVHGHYYGTPRGPVDNVLNTGRSVVLDVDVQGGAQIKTEIPEAVTIFLLPPSLDVLKQRLIRRGTDDEATIEKRLKNARIELKEADKYDYIVVNDDLNQTIKEVKAIFKKQMN